MLILIPPSEGKAKVESTSLTYDKTKFKFESEDSFTVLAIISE